jgi:DNA-binding LacI/PurR family transcriptional regulator
LLRNLKILCKMALEVVMTQQIGKRGRRTRRVRLEDLATQVGVSVSTVSRALAGEKGVRPSLRALVLDAARAANYAMPSRVAGSRVMVAASRAAIIDYQRNQFTLHVLDGLRQRAAALEVELTTRSVGDRAEELAMFDEARRDPGVIGVLLLTLDDEDMLGPARDFGKPVVLVNGDDPSMELSSVTPCNRSAARVATEHLIALGHERIAFLVRSGRRTIERRREGWADALRQRGLPVDEELVIEVSDWLPELAAEAIRRRHAETGIDFTAVVAAGDSLAFGATTALGDLGIAVPRDVSLVSIDDLPHAQFLNPPLTAVHIPMRELGAVGLDILRDELAGLPVPKKRVELACRLVVRGSSARLGETVTGSAGPDGWRALS